MMNSSHSSTASSSAPGDREKPGSSSQTPFFETISDFKVIFSGDKTRAAIHRACGSENENYFQLATLVPDKFSLEDRVGLHENLLAATVSILTAAAVHSVGLGITGLAMTSTLAIATVRFFHEELILFIVEAEESAKLLHQEVETYYETCMEGRFFQKWRAATTDTRK